MRPLSKSATALLALSLMAGAITVSGRGAAQEETKSPAPKAVKKKAADPKANEAQKAKPKPAAAAPASAAKTAARPAGEPKPGGEPRPAGEPKSAGNPRAMAVLPKPSPLAEEAQHVALFDSAITPVRDIAISPDDAKRLREAIAAAAGGRLTEARSLRDGLSEPAGRKLVDWFTFRGGYGTASEIRAFLDANPAWPDRGLLTQRAEEQLFLSNASSRDVRVFFASAEPRTAIGHAALAAALMTDKETDKAKVLARKAWTEMDLPSAAEQAFLARVGGLLDESDHKRRLDRLLLNDVRAADRADRAAVIKRTIALLPEAERKTAEARLAVFMSTGASPCRRRRRSAARRRRRRPGRSCWLSRKAPARSHGPTAGGRSGAPTPTRRSGSASPRPPTTSPTTRAHSASTPPRTRPSSPDGSRCAT